MMRIAKATPEDFQAVRDLLQPMGELFDTRYGFLCDEDWKYWDEDGVDKQELLEIRAELARSEHEDEEHVDNRLILYEFIKRRFKRANRGSWQRVVIAADALIGAFCDPHEDCLALRPELERAAENIMLGE